MSVRVELETARPVAVFVKVSCGSRVNPAELLAVMVELFVMLRSLSPMFPPPVMGMLVVRVEPPAVTAGPLKTFPVWLDMTTEPAPFSVMDA